MKEIELTKGYKTIIDDEDFDFVTKRSWQIQFGKDKVPYAGTTFRTKGGMKHVRLHRYILGATKGTFVDHMNRNTLDNRRSNLRLCTRSQNMANRKVNKNSPSGFKGITWDKKARKWKSWIGVDHKRHYLGLYSTPEEAAAAYNVAAKEHFGEFARLNTL